MKFTSIPFPQFRRSQLFRSARWQRKRKKKKNPYYVFIEERKHDGYQLLKVKAM